MQQRTLSLTSLPDSTLLQKTESLAAEERRITLSVLHHLAEIERRHLWARESYPSLFVFCVQRLKYTEAQAQRRISAMRLLCKVPEVESKVASGELKVSQLAQVQTFIRAEKKDSGRKVSAAETRRILGSLAGKSTRESENLLLSLSPGLQKQKKAEERIKPLTDAQTEIRFTVDSETLTLLEEAKALFSHNRDMNPAAARFFKEGLKLLIEQKRKERTHSSKRQVAPAAQTVNPDELENRHLCDSSPSRDQAVHFFSTKEKTRSASVALATQQVQPSSRHTQHLQQKNKPQNRMPPSRFIRIGLKRDAFIRAEDRCEFSNAQGVRCSSRYALELHHVQPYARGGAHTPDNLRVYCKGHNQAQGKWDFP